MLVVSERWVGDGDRLIFWSKVLLATIAALLPHLAGVAQPWVTEGRKPSVCKLILTLASCPQLTPTPTDSSRLRPGYIIVSRPPASVVPPLIYTSAYLDWRLGRGSIYNNMPLTKEACGAGCWSTTYDPVSSLCEYSPVMQNQNPTPYFLFEDCW